MMGSRGWNITLYSGDKNHATNCEHVSLYTSAEQTRWYGDVDNNNVPSRAGIWDSAREPWRVMNRRAVSEIEKRANPHDILLLSGGCAQKPISDELPYLLSAEYAVGYPGFFSPRACFPSRAWQNYLYGKNGWDGRWMDAVIPHFVDPDDYALAETRGDYLLYIGRMVERKGVRVAVEIAKACGRELVMAGPGVKETHSGRIVCEELELEGDNLTYVGVVGEEERGKLMGDAYAVLAPTTYIEPFGLVAVEAQFCGTPAITTDFGAFTETVADELRFSTLQEAVNCVERAGSADSSRLRSEALQRWSLDAIAPLYEAWLARLTSLWGDGWYERSDPASKMAALAS